MAVDVLVRRDDLGRRGRCGRDPGALGAAGGVGRSHEVGAQAMMQLARRASLVVVLLLLVSIGTACAECAWVLWSGRGDKAPHPGRIVMSAFPKADDCQAALAAIVEGMK